jgi:hypothetical protein
MRLTFPFCLLLIVHFGANMHAWGKVAVNPEPVTAHQVFSWVDEADPDAPPMGVSSGDWLCHDAAGFENGPNLYAYVKENPWSAFDPDGLKTKDDYRNDIVGAGQCRDEKMSKISGERGSRAWYQKQARINEEYKYKVYRAKKGIDEITATARKMESVSRMEAGSINDELVNDEHASYVNFNRLDAVGAFLPTKLGEHWNHGEWGGVAKETMKEVVIAFATLGMGKLLSPAAKTTLALPAPRQVAANWGVNTCKHGGEMFAIEHIMYRHAANSGFANVSRFAEGAGARQIRGMVDDALRYGKQTGTGTFEYNL